MVVDVELVGLRFVVGRLLRCECVAEELACRVKKRNKFQNFIVKGWIYPAFSVLFESSDVIPSICIWLAESSIDGLR